MRRNQFQRVTAPGLPSWPRLYVDLKSRHAYIVVRHPTWRSYQCAWRIATVMSWLGCMVAAVFVWNALAGFDNVFRILLTLVSCAVLFPVVKFVMVHGSVGFLARQFFPTRTKLWVSAKGFAFRSRLYARPIVVWRHWKGQSVRLSFILSRDDDAASAAINLKPTQKRLQATLNEALMLEVVISAATPRDKMISNEQLLRRTIPLTEVSSRYARKFTTVFSAAVAVTSEVTQASQQTEGIDIDG